MNNSLFVVRLDLDVAIGARIYLDTTERRFNKQIIRLAYDRIIWGQNYSNVCSSWQLSSRQL